MIYIMLYNNPSSFVTTSECIRKQRQQGGFKMAKKTKLSKEYRESQSDRKERVNGTQFRPTVFRDKTKYSRKTKHKGSDNQKISHWNNSECDIFLQSLSNLKFRSTCIVTNQHEKMPYLSNYQSRTC